MLMSWFDLVNMLAFHTMEEGSCFSELGGFLFFINLHLFIGE